MLKNFLSNTKGNFGILMALGSGVIFICIGAAIDTAGATRTKQNAQASLDMAMLAAAANASEGYRRGNLDNIDYEANVHDFMLANGYNAASPLPTVQVEDSYLTAQVTTPYVTVFGSFLGKDQMNINIVSQVSLRGSAKVQIALVLDNTQSMSLAGKMNALKQGAKDLVDAVEDSGSQSQIAIVPFAKYVGIDTSHRTSPWLDVPAEYDTDRTWQQATHTGGTCIIEDQEYNVDGIIEIRPTTVCSDQITTYETQYRVVESRWEGCVGVRDQPYDSLDGEYAIPVPALLHRIPHEVTGLHVDTEAWCPRPITPLTNDYAQLRTEIAELYGTGRTYIPGGLIWGQRVLSPIAPFEEAASTGAVKNIMVIMSDGKNTLEIRDTAATNTNHEAPPYIYSPSSAGEPVPAANALTEELCTEIKAQGTEIYTIAFQINDTTTQSVLQNCASTNTKAFVASNNAGLVRAFGHIASSLESVIRLSN